MAAVTGRWAGLRQFLYGSPASNRAVPEPATVPGQSISGSDPDAADARAQQELQRVMQDFDRLIEDLRKAAERDGLHDDGPMVPTFQGLRFCLQALREMTGSMMRAEQRYVGRILGTLVAAREAVAAEVKRAQVQMEAAMAARQHQMTDQIADGVVRQASKGIDRLARNFDLKAGGCAAIFLLITFAVTQYVTQTRDAMALSAAVAAASADARARTLAEIHETEAGLRAAFATNGLAGAEMWQKFMLWNNLDDALAQCKGDKLFVQDNRKGCLVPLWFEAAPPALPPSPLVSIEHQPASPLPAPAASSPSQPEPSAWAFPTRPAMKPVHIGPTQ